LAAKAHASIARLYMPSGKPEQALGIPLERAGGRRRS